MAQTTPEFERFWHDTLHEGVIRGTAAKPRGGSPGMPAAAAPAPAEGAAGGGLEIVFRPDPTIWDGRYSNNAWLQELPKPLTHLTWDNAAIISPSTAKRIGLVSNVTDFGALAAANGEMVDLTYRGQTLPVAVVVLPGQPDDTVTLSLGYGRRRAGKLGTDAGFNAYALRTADSPWFGGGLEIRKAGRRYNLVSAQHHFTMEGRGFVQYGDLEQLQRSPEHPEFMHVEEHGEGSPPTLYPEGWPSDRQAAEHPQPGVKDPGTWDMKEWGRSYRPDAPVAAWGMVIDLNSCIGCSACTLACQAENNIATVGKDQVAINREMHWLRVSHYYTGTVEEPDTVFQPVPCMHCEKAPCEPVCPVEATSHSVEGINEMTYNRCIGTRYCANNCPYKVRRFNFFQYSDMSTPTLQMMRNPDVTVRARGVMEKCTYCVQRTWQARIEAEKEERPIRDGDVKTACQQVCPTEAIIFGDVNDRRSNGGKGSYVRQLKHLPLNYGLLTELNTRPRTTYLARLRNPNAALEPAATGAGTEERH
jgi:Fe-S-cluster-containing dehydrogenase component